MILKIVVALILCEAVTEILVDSALFDRLRKWIGGEKEEGQSGKYGLKGVLVWCGYCVSMWIGVGAAYLLCIRGAVPALGWAEPLVWGVVIHRGSNLWHETIARYLKRIPLSLFFRGWVTREDSPPNATPPPAEQITKEKIEEKKDGPQ